MREKHPVGTKVILKPFDYDLFKEVWCMHEDDMAWAEELHDRYADQVFTVIMIHSSLGIERLRPDGTREGWMEPHVELFDIATQYEDAARLV